MGENLKPRSLHQLWVTMHRVGADVLEKRITRRQYDAVFAQVEAELAAQGCTFLDLLDLPDESPRGRGEAVERGPRQGAGAGRRVV
jgi:predicted regulator of amino acid metabolism with ACT domain